MTHKHCLKARLNKSPEQVGHVPNCFSDQFTMEKKKINPELKFYLSWYSLRLKITFLLKVAEYCFRDPDISAASLRFLERVHIVQIARDHGWIHATASRFPLQARKDWRQRWCTNNETKTSRSIFGWNVCFDLNTIRQKFGTLTVSTETSAG